MVPLQKNLVVVFALLFFTSFSSAQQMQMSANVLVNRATQIFEETYGFAKLADFQKSPHSHDLLVEMKKLIRSGLDPKQELESTQFNLDPRSHVTYSLARWACEFGDAELIELMHQKGVTFWSPVPFATQGIIDAMIYENSAAVHALEGLALLKKLPSPQLPSTFYTALDHSFFDIAEHLLKIDPTLLDSDDSGEPLAFSIVASDNVAALDFLIKHHANLAELNSAKQNLLFVATPKQADFLKEKKIALNLEQVDEEKRTPLLFHVQMSHPEQVAYLLARGSSLNGNPLTALLNLAISTQKKLPRLDNSFEFLEKVSDISAQLLSDPNLVHFYRNEMPPSPLARIDEMLCAMEVALTQLKRNPPSAKQLAYLGGAALGLSEVFLRHLHTLEEQNIYTYSPTEQKFEVAAKYKFALDKLLSLHEDLIVELARQSPHDDQAPAPTANFMHFFLYQKEILKAPLSETKQISSVPLHFMKSLEKKLVDASETFQRTQEEIYKSEKPDLEQLKALQDQYIDAS